MAYQGGVPLPQTFHREIFGDKSGKMRQGKKVKKIENVEENEEKWKKEGGKLGKIEKNEKGKTLVRLHWYLEKFI